MKYAFYIYGSYAAVIIGFTSLALYGIFKHARLKRDLEKLQSNKNER